MAEINVNSGNWLGSEDGKVTKTVTLTSESAETVTEGESLIIKSGTLIQDSSMGYGLLLRDVDVTEGPRVAQLMIRGKYIGSKLPYELSGEAKTALAQIGMFDVESSESPAGEGFRIVNNSSVSVEMYYEIDKEEYGNTIVNPGSSATISIDYQYPYYLRYSSDASGNTQIFKGVYQGSSYNGSVGYYDENIQPPEAIGSNTEWRFNEGDNGTLTLSGGQGGNGITINNNGGETLNVYLNGDKDDTLITSIANGSIYTLSNFETEEGLDYKFQFESSVNASASYNGLYQGNLYSGNANCNIDGLNYIWDPTTYDYRWHFNEWDNGGLIISAQSGPQYTLHYALGSYADSHDEDKLPSDVTVSEGETVYVDFSTYPESSSEGYDFMGWSTNDGQNIPEYSESGANSIIMYNDVTLYPTYAVHVASNYLAIDNTYGSSNILVEWYDEDKGQWKTSIEVSSNGYEDFEYNTERAYRISFSSGNFQNCVFTGVLGNDSYVSEPCVDGGSGVISAPDSHSWQFTSGVYYLTVQQPSVGETLEIVNQSSEDVEIYYENDKTEYGNTTVTSGSSDTISLNVQYPYYIRYLSGGSDNRHSFEGTYQGVSGYATDVYYYDGNICPPLQETNTEWSFQSGDGGTLLIRDAK